MLGRLEAEEALAHISQVGAGSGTMQESDQREYRRGLLRAVSGGSRPVAEKASAASLRQMGIVVVGGD